MSFCTDELSTKKIDNRSRLWEARAGLEKVSGSVRRVLGDYRKVYFY